MCHCISISIKYLYVHGIEQDYNRLSRFSPTPLSYLIFELLKNTEHERRLALDRSNTKSSLKGRVTDAKTTAMTSRHAVFVTDVTVKLGTVCGIHVITCLEVIHTIAHVHFFEYKYVLSVRSQILFCVTLPFQDIIFDLFHCFHVHVMQQTMYPLADIVNRLLVSLCYLDRHILTSLLV